MTCRPVLASVILLPMTLSLLVHGEPAGAGDSPGMGPVPKRVTIQADKILLSQALKQLAEQTGIPVERSTKGDPELKLALKQVPFWLALDAIARQAKARPYLFQRNGRVALVDGGPEQPVSYSGIFRTSVRRVSSVRDFETDAHYCIVSLEVAWEPGFQPFRLETRPRELVVQDDQGRKLPVPFESTKEPIDGRLATVLDLRLPAPKRSAGKLGLVKGELAIVGPSQMLTFNLGPLDKAQGVQQKKEGVRIEVAKVTLEQSRWTVQVTLEHPAGGPEFESWQSWLVNNEVYLTNERDKKRFPNNGSYRADKTAANRAVISYHFVDEPKKGLVRGPASSWELVCVTPARIIEVPVEFEFRDLPLP
jgi:hypothetical protein